VGSFDTSRTAIRHQLSDLINYRELIKLLTIKDVKLRYKGSILGFLWSLINPLMMMVVFYIVFVVLLPQPVSAGCKQTPPVGGSLADIQAAQQCKISNNYAPFILIGILAWNFTSGSIMAGMNSLLGNASIAKKVYFPREVLPISAVLAQFVNFMLALIPLTIVLLASGLIPSRFAVLLPVIFLSHILFLTGLALILSIVALYFRDLLVIMEVILQAWFFLSPVIYSMDQIYKDGAAVMYWLNPIASYIQTYRTLLFFNYDPGLDFTIRTCLTGVVVFLIGYAFFMFKRKQIGEML
jgi:lipopolysaccharide transport system permease protein